jgi:hypothetical protein
MAQKTLSELGHESCALAAMIEALDALYDAADGPADCPLAKRARNGIRPMIEATIAAAWALNDQIERAALPSRKK